MTSLQFSDGPYQQPSVANVSTSSLSSLLYVPPTASMLHRTPSGAQRKIRQKREERNQQQQQQNRLLSSPINSSSSVSPTQQQNHSSTSLRDNNATHQKQSSVSSLSSSPVDYRSLVDLHGYRSIIHDDTLSHSASSSIRHISTSDNGHHRRPTKFEATSDNSTNGELTTITPSWEEEGKNDSDVMKSKNTYDGATFEQQTTAINGSYVGKPTIQVYPMPAPRISSLSSSISSNSPPETALTSKKAPPVPKKPNQTITKKFEQLAETINGSESLWRPRRALKMDASDVDNKINESKTAQPITHKIQTSISGNSNLSSSTSCLNVDSSVESLPPLYNTPSVSRLNPDARFNSASSLSGSNSPSMLSLQTSLSYAVHNPDLHTNEQLKELEKMCVQSIQLLSKKASERELDKEMVSEELQNIDQIRVAILKSLAKNESLSGRVMMHVMQGEKLAELETRLQLQLERLEFSSDRRTTNEEMMQKRKKRLLQQLEDALAIRVQFDRRDEELDTELGKLLSANQMLEWRFYRASVLKLTIERKQIDDKLRNVRVQIEALRSMATLLNNKETH